MVPDMRYDSDNIFARILRGEIPCRRVFENAHVLAFHDIHPKAPVHVLLIPKGAYGDASDFHARSTTEEIAAFYQACAHVAAVVDVASSGYRLVTNCGPHAGQEVGHFHVHLLGGGPLQPF